MRHHHSSPHLPLPRHNAPPPPPPYDLFKQAPAPAASSVSLPGSVSFAAVLDVHHEPVPPVPPLPPAMAGDKRPAWRRGSSTRSHSIRKAQNQNQQQQQQQQQVASLGPTRIKTTGRPDALDGFVPYRPPYASRSAAELLTPPVQPSGAQGIGLAPDPVKSVPPIDDKSQRRNLFGWPFSLSTRRRRKESLASMSTPALLHPGASTASFGTTYAGHGGSHGTAQARFYRQQDLQSGQSNKYGTRFSAYAPRGRQYVSSNTHQTNPSTSSAHFSSSHLSSHLSSTMTPSPSVPTGLSAPKMLFSPLSRNLRPDAGSNPHLPFQSTPNLPSPPHSDSQVEHGAVDARPYPRVGNNHHNFNTYHNGQYHQGNNASERHLSTSYAHLVPNRSSVTLHSEGSRSRLTVTTVCDALTFPRPRMNPHDITPPESPRGNDTDMEDDDVITPVFSEAVAQSKAREAEREEWAAVMSRRGRSHSIRRAGESTSAPSTPGLRHRLSERYTGSRHGRSNSQSSSVRSFFSRSGPQRAQSHRNGRTSAEPGSNTDHTASLDSIHTPISRSQSHRAGRKTTGIFANLATPDHGKIQKSSSSPQLSADGDGDEAPKRSQSMKYGSTRSAPDITGLNGLPTSPRSTKHRATGPPRTFQLRIPPTQAARGGPMQAGVVVVGPSSSGASRTPRAIDFAELPALPVRAPSPSPPPQVPTPDRGSPFGLGFDADAIGVAITTAGNEAAAPPPVVERQKMQSPVLQPSPFPKEPPSSAHARYLIARQHRHSVTIRAFQSPAMAHPKAGPISPPNKLVASSSFSHRRKRSSPPPPLPPFQRYTQALEGELTSPVSPRSPVSPEGKARGTSTLGPRAWAAKTGSGRVRRRGSPTSSSHAWASKSEDTLSKRPESSPPSFGRHRELQSLTNLAPPLRTDKDLPPTPMSSLEASPNPPQADRLPNQRAPSRNLPLTPDRRPVSGDGGSPLSIASQGRPVSIGMLGALAATAAEAAALSRAETPSRSAASSLRGHPPVPVPAAPNPLRIQTQTPPPAKPLPTIMDASPTPVRQRTVSVLAPPPDSPTPTPKGKTAPLTADSPDKVPFPGHPFSSLRTSRPRSPMGTQAQTVFNRQSMPVRLTSTSSIQSAKSARSHRSIPSVSAVSPAPQFFRGEYEAQNEHSRVSPDFFTHALLPQKDARTALGVDETRGMPSVRDASNVSAALADTSGVLGNSSVLGLADSPQRIPPVPLVASPYSTSPQIEMLQRSTGTSSHQSHGSRSESDDGGPIPPPVLRTINQSAVSPLDAVASRFASASSLVQLGSGTPLSRAHSAAPSDSASAMSHSSYFTTETADEWKPARDDLAFGSVQTHDEGEESDGSDTTLPDMFPCSSSSALSHYTDAEDGEGSTWGTPVEATMSPIPTLPPIAVLTPLETVSESSHSSTTTPQASHIVLNDSPRGSTPTHRPPTATSDDMENLTVTPKLDQLNTSVSGFEDAFEYDPTSADTSLSIDPRSARRNSGGSASSGSEVSVRQSLEENFRGLFYRPPNMPSPEDHVRRRRLPSHLPQIVPSAVSSPSRGLAHSKTSSTSASTFELNSPLDEGGFELRPVDPKRKSMLRSNLASSTSSEPANTLSATNPSMGLGIIPDGNFLAGFGQNRIAMRQPLPETLARDDSWITQSYHRLSQVVARSATPATALSLRKARPYSAPQGGMPFSPTTFGVHTDRFDNSAGSTPRSTLQTPGSSIAEHAETPEVIE